MSDNVIVYFVGYKGTLFACSLVDNTYVGISNMDVYGAIVRKLDWAGIPHAGWAQGEPSSMEEFGTLARDANALDWLHLQINDRVSQTVEHSAESRRMLGVLLGWSTGNAQELTHAQLIKSTPLQVVCSNDGVGAGAWYAIGPGVFFHLKTFDEVGALRDAGVLSRNAWSHPDAVIKEMRRLVLQPNGEMWDPTVKVPVTEKAKSLVAAPAETVTDVPAKVAAAKPAAAAAPVVKEIEPWISRIDPADPKLPSTVDEALALVAKA